MTRFATLFHTAVLALCLSAPAIAAGSGRVPLPSLPAAKGEQCVEDTDVMRRRHMDFLMFHRDKTLREGIRTPKHSLKACLGCHAAGEGQDQPFCKSCHAYVGVKLDCFECHTNQPERSSVQKSATE